MAEKIIKIALAGNPNAGKTTLFNALTGSNQFVGNWPGVTVEKKEGNLKGRDDAIVVDLPGIYSLSPYTLEEEVARKYLVLERPDAILNIVDGTNLERNLYLTTQLLELGIPVVIAINMIDVVQKSGDKIDLKMLSSVMGCPVVEVSALKESGIDEAIEKAIEAAKAGEHEPSYIFSGLIEHTIAHIEEAAVHHLPKEQHRWYAIKIFERDEKVLKALSLSSEVLAHIEEDIKSAETQADDDAEGIIANERYNYIEGVVKRCYTKKYKNRITATEKIDRIVTNRYLAFPIFALVMFLVYYISVSVVGTVVTDWANDGVFGDGWSLFGLWVPGVPVVLEGFLVKIGCAPWLQSLLLDGIVAGVGAVLGFVPQLFVLFAMLAFLEACGYMSRIAFVLDRVFRKFGLSGKSFIPLLIGTGCSVPGIMASRTIENERDRRMTVITTSFIPCGAKLPVIALIASALFDGAWWVAPSAYFVGIAAVVSSGVLLKKTPLFAGENAPFVMELPAYRLPTAINIWRSVWERGWSFIKKAGTVILLSTVFIWTGAHFGFLGGFRFSLEMPLEDSLLGYLGRCFAWLFVPLGFGDIHTAVATLMGLIAKEEIVSVLGVLSFASMGKLAGYSFMLFNLLCAPCFAAVGAIRREMNSPKWTAFAVAYQCAFAYAVSLMVYQIGSAFSGNLQTVWFAFALLVLGAFLYLLIRPVKKAK